MYSRTLPVVLLFLISPALGQTPGQQPAAEKPSLLGSFLDAGMPDEVLFAVRKPSIDGHWYANIAYYSTDQLRTTFPMNSGGKLCIYNAKTKQIRTIFADPEGNVRDPQIYFDAQKLVCSYLPQGKRHYSLYEINIDGSGLKQLTGRGEDVSPGMEDSKIFSPPGWDDFEPTYLPDGQIIFCSTRANRYVQCWMTQVGTLYKCDADGSNIRALSANIEHDNTPWVLSNGQVAYMRWEYVDRFHMGYHHLWSMNPDGTRQMVLYGNQINHGTILAPKPVPHSPKLVVTWSPGHGLREHYGRIALIDPRLGPDDPQGVRYISKDNLHCDPWAFSENHFMVANKTAIELLNGLGETEVLYRLPEELAKQGFWIGEPRPVMKRQREPVIADQTAPSADSGTLALANIYRGRKMQNVKPGTVKNLLVYEVLPKPINYAGAMSEMSAGGTFSVERLIGSVPVSADHSPLAGRRRQSRGNLCGQQPRHDRLLRTQRQRSQRQRLAGNSDAGGGHEPPLRPVPRADQGRKADRHVPAPGALLCPLLPAGRIPEEQVPRAYDVRRRRPVQSTSDLQSVVPGTVESGSRAAGQTSRRTGRLSGPVRRSGFSGQDRLGLSGHRRGRRSRPEAYSGGEQPLLHDPSQSQ